VARTRLLHRRGDASDCPEVDLDSASFLSCDRRGSGRKARTQPPSALGNVGGPTSTVSDWLIDLWTSESVVRASMVGDT
jgi:hypothetical protein